MIHPHSQWPHVIPAPEVCQRTCQPVILDKSLIATTRSGTSIARPISPMQSQYPAASRFNFRACSETKRNSRKKSLSSVFSSIHSVALRSSLTLRSKQNSPAKSSSGRRLADCRTELPTSWEDVKPVMGCRDKNLRDHDFCCREVSAHAFSTRADSTRKPPIHFLASGVAFSVTLEPSRSTMMSIDWPIFAASNA